MIAPRPFVCFFLEYIISAILFKGGFSLMSLNQFSPQFICFRTFLPKLNECDTDDDVAMSFLKSKEGFEMYLQYLVGQSQAESTISDKSVHQFFKVTQLFSFESHLLFLYWAISPISTSYQLIIVIVKGHLISITT